MVKEWAGLFKGLDDSEAQLEDLAKSFAFESCMKREGLNQVLTEHSERVAEKNAPTGSHRSCGCMIQ
jgi:hypothetical protein